jgi:hypothetical protein
MNESERTLITNAVRIIEEVVEKSEREEIGEYNRKAVAEGEAREKVSREHANQLHAIKLELHDAQERLEVALMSGDLLNQRVDAYLSMYLHLDRYAHRAQEGLDELVALVRDIKTTCKGHRDSACSAQVLEKIAAYHEQLNKRVAIERPNVEKIDALRDQMNATRAARIEAAKAVKS